jgi:hypothetical protein
MYKKIKPKDLKDLISNTDVDIFIETSNRQELFNICCVAADCGYDVNNGVLERILSGVVGGVFFNIIDKRLMTTRLVALYDGHLEGDYGVTVRYKLFTKTKLILNK